MTTTYWNRPFLTEIADDLLFSFVSLPLFFLPLECLLRYFSRTRNSDKSIVPLWSVSNSSSNISTWFISTLSSPVISWMALLSWTRLREPMSGEGMQWCGQWITWYAMQSRHTFLDTQIDETKLTRLVLVVLLKTDSRRSLLSYGRHSISSRILCLEADACCFVYIHLAILVGLIQSELG